jgi:hypothetical protein
MAGLAISVNDSEQASRHSNVIDAATLEVQPNKGSIADDIAK